MRAADPRPFQPRLPLTIWLLGLTSFFTDVGSEMVFPLLPGFIAGLGGFALLGLVEGLADATAALVKIPAGALSDRLPRRLPLVHTGYGIAGAVRPLMAFATAPWHAVAIRVSDRVGKGIRSAPRDALIGDAAPPGREASAYGLHRAMDHAGAVVGPLVASGLIGLGFAVTDVFLCAAIPGVIAFGVLWLVRESPRRAPMARVASSPDAARAPLPRDLVRLITILAVFSLGASTDAFLLVRASELGTDPALVPLLWALLHVVKMLTSWGFGIVADRVPRLRLIRLGLLVYTLAYVALGFATEAWHVWAIVLVYGTWYGLAEPAEKALIRDLAPPSERGRAFGWHQAATGVAAVPAGLLTGALWVAASPPVALWTCAAFGIIALVLLARWSATRSLN